MVEYDASLDLTISDYTLQKVLDEGIIAKLVGVGSVMNQG